MQITDAQADLRRAYVGGGPGAVVSSLVWFAAFYAYTFYGTAFAFTLLFFGGFLIFPVATLICRYGFGRAKEAAENPFGLIALESTIAMIGCLLAAWLLLPVAPEYTFPVAAIAIGTHYFAFKTAYGDRTYWVLAAAITLVGAAVIFRFAPIPGGPIAAVAIIELVFGIVLTARSMKLST